MAGSGTHGPAHVQAPHLRLELELGVVGRLVDCLNNDASLVVNVTHDDGKALLPALAKGTEVCRCKVVARLLLVDVERMAHLCTGAGECECVGGSIVLRLSTTDTGSHEHHSSGEREGGGTG